MAKDELNIAIIDYELGNLHSVKQACVSIGMTPVVTSSAADILAADGVVLPGVGAFGDAMNNLKKLDLVSPLHDLIASGKPLLGICLGLQLLFTESEEFGAHKGLDIIPGTVLKFPAKTAAGAKVKVPQIGWNRIYCPKGRSWEKSPLHDIDRNEYMYFVHSYYVKPEDPADILTLTEYADIEYCSSVLKGNIFAAQFHPEKSAHTGMKIYRNWGEQVAQTKGRRS